MAAPTIKIGNVSGAIYQPERPLQLNPDGSAQATLTYKCADGSPAVTVPAYLTPHPDFSSLLLYEANLDLEPGGVYRISGTYKGVFASNPEQLAQHECTRTVTEAPIETHPKFSLPRDAPPVNANNLAAIELALQNNTAALRTWDELTTLLFNLKRRGVDSYLKPGSVYKKTYCAREIPTGALLANVGKIVTPPSPAPTPPSGQNYLMMGVSWTKQAGVVTISEEYQLSGPGGWDPNIYEEA